MFNAYREYWNNITQLINLVLGIYSAITGVYRYIEAMMEQSLKEYRDHYLFLADCFNLVGKLYCSSKKIA